MFDINLYKQKRRAENKKALVNYLGGSCVECGVTKDLQFDHIDRTSKNYDITANLTNSLKALKVEADLCQLLCRGCHDVKTNKDLGRVNERPVEGVKHGSIRAYQVYKCRCGLCRENYSIYQKKYYRRRRLAHVAG